MQKDIIRKKNNFCTLTRVSPVVLTDTVLASTNAVSRFSSVLDTSQIKSRTQHQPSMLCPPSCFPRSKGRSTPRTAFPLLASRWHPFPGSKGRSSATTQVVSHHESWLLVLLLPCPSLLWRTSSGNTAPDQRGVRTPLSRRGHWLPICHQRTQLLTRAF